MRVHEIAKELGVSSKEVIASLKNLGVEVASHMSALDEQTVEILMADRKPAPETASPPPKQQPEKAPEAPPKPPASPKPADQHKAEPAQKDEAAGREEPTVEGSVISVSSSITVKELAAILGKLPNEIITELMSMSVFASINAKLDLAVARTIAEKHGFTLEHEKKVAKYVEIQKKRDAEASAMVEDKPEDLKPRPPVVTFLGHVDHGKTSLLDSIRKTSVVSGEHGGITQHIGAYTVEVGGRAITFLDTPGHEAFTAMRARGANLTDIAVIIVAADDGIMPQTKEAIMHAKASGVAMMVAINKMDLPGANAGGVKQQLQAEGLAPEEWGGDTICAEVSAQTGKGVDHLLEMIALQADILELKANPNRKASGFVIEARLEPGMGPTANVLVKNGTLKLGDPVCCDRFWGKVRALINDHGVKVKSAGPSIPVKCLGLAGVPPAGAEFKVCANDKEAKRAAEEAGGSSRKTAASAPRAVASLDALFDQMKQADKVELNLILKADTQGSIEAITHALGNIKSAKVSLKIILSATGNITVNDVMLAKASNAVIMGFHVGREPGVDSSARHEGVDIRTHNIIYEMLDEVTEAMTGLLAPIINEKILGQAEIRQVFPIGKRANVAGCLVMSGVLKASGKIRVKRKDEILFNGAIASLKHFQDSVAEVRESQECGIRLDGFNDFSEGDILECYELESKTQTL